MMTTSLDQQQILALTAGEIGKILRSHTLSVVDVVKATGQRIQEHNSYGLNLAAIISVAPEANVLKLAEQLDRELAENKPRGPLHGIPVVVKVRAGSESHLSFSCPLTILDQDCFATHPDLGMATSAGSYAFLQNQPIKNAPVVEKVPERCPHETFKPSLIMSAASRQRGRHHRQREPNREFECLEM